MPTKSSYPPIDIPEQNILSYIFPVEDAHALSDEPTWIEAADVSVYLTPQLLFAKAKSLAAGIENRQGADGGPLVKRGEVVSIFSPNQIQIPVAYLGIVGSGRVFCGINADFSAREAAFQMQDADTKVLLVHPSLLHTAVAAAQQIGLSKDRIFHFSNDENSTRFDVRDWKFLFSSVEEGNLYSWPNFDGEKSKNTIATINYSSGTTGLPKGVCISHYNLIANVRQTIFSRNAYKSFYERGLKERWVGFLPLYHAYGQLYAVLMAAKLRVPTYIMRKFQFEAYLQIIQDHKITQLQIAPPIIIMLAKRPETKKYNLTSVIDMTCGAAPLSQELQNEVSKLFNVKINQGWGMTELTCSGILVPGGLSDQTGSVGVLIPNSECKLLDDAGREVGDGERGEILFRGPNVCIGYWKNEVATREAFTSDGWLKTGDIAIRKDGWFWIVDRKKEMIKVNGLQIAPAELEAMLLKHEDIADAGVVGLKLNDQEFPRAYVALKETAREREKRQRGGKPSQTAVQDWLKPQVIKHKWLTGGVAFVNEVPKSPSGKILRKVLREWAKKDAASFHAQQVGSPKL